VNRDHVLTLLREHLPMLRSRFDVQFYLEDLFGREVDLVSDKALRDRSGPYVERNAIAV
jgi:predicted nucleotidyltransferase